MMYNTKLTAEKEEASGKGKKKKAAPVLKGGGAKGYELNNNAAMVAEVLGADQDDDEYGDYGDEAQGFKKENEG